MAKRSQEEVDDRAWPDGRARFFPTNDQKEIPGQMAMSEGTPNTWGVGNTPVDSEPYAKRPAVQGKQLALGKAGAFQPNDAALHAIRMQNPALNDYHLELSQTSPHQHHTVTAYHVPTNTTAGRLQWRGSEIAKREGSQPGEVLHVGVNEAHAGRGLSTAMWDYAHFHAGRQGSEIAQPVHSEERSIEGNHWAHFVGGAAMARTKGHGVQSLDWV